MPDSTLKNNRIEHKSFYTDTKDLIDEYVKRIYKISRSFPKEEMFGITSQLRRASLSVALNYIEGYARIYTKTFSQFLTISYGSLKETLYILDICLSEGYINKSEYTILINIGDKIGARLWGTIKKLKDK